MESVSKGKGKWRTAAAIGFATTLAFAAWRIGSASDTAIERVAPTPAATKDEGDEVKPFHISEDWKLGKRTWGDDSDGDESDRKLPPADESTPKPAYDGLDIAGAAR